MNEHEKFTADLTALCMRLFSAAPESLERLSGGASQESWQFAVDRVRYVLRRTPHGQADEDGAARLPLAHEAQILQAARRGDLAVPEVHYICTAQDGLGSAYIMEYISGETIARKILRDAAFDNVRGRLASQCGTFLAQLHSLDVETLAAQVLPHVPRADARAELARYEGFLRRQTHPHPVFEVAIQWLKAHLPPPPSASAKPVLVHGDFRNGNLMITPQDGMCAVLDWELAHIGDPMEDLGWICVPSWRFGLHDMPVGGFGKRAQIYAAYRAGGGVIDEAVARFWEILGTLKWGIMCSVLMVHAFESGRDASVERAAIGRRASETEIDLLRMLLEQD